MFCPTCGKQAAPGETACANCHNAFAFAGVPAGYPVMAVPSRLSRHLHIVGILWAIRGGLSLLGWLIALPFITHFVHFGFNRSFEPWQHGPFAAPFWLPFITAFVILHAALSLITAYGLLTRQSW